MGLGMSGLSRAGRRRARLQTCWWLSAFAVALGFGVAAGAPPGFSGQPFERSQSFWNTGPYTGRIWFICSSMDYDDVAVITLPDRRRRINIINPLLKGNPAYFRLGEPDPGAGQIYWPISDEDGKQIGALHAFNPGALDDQKAATTATFTSILLPGPGGQWNCRWLERTRLMGFSARRTVIITQGADGGLEYRTYDFKDAGKLKRIELDGAQQTTTASLDIRGGRKSARGFQFQHGGFTYEVTADPKGAAIAVRNNGKTALREPLIAWTIAPAP
jgi:hypothetical protein